MPNKSLSWNLYEVGKCFSWKFKISDDDVIGFIKISGDDSPIHINATYAQNLGYDREILHGALICSQLSALIGKKLPDQNLMTVGFSIDFSAPAYVNEELLFIAELVYLSDATGLVEFKYRISRPMKTIARGTITAKWMEK